MASSEDVLGNGGNLSISRYVRRRAGEDAYARTGGDLRDAWADFDAGSAAFWREMDDVVRMVDRIAAGSRADG